jgi:hypothetical protein
MSINPYESPRIPAGDRPQDAEATMAWPATGAFRYYQTLVWNTGTALPRICVRTGLPADAALAFALRPLIDDDGSIAAAYQLKPKLYSIVLPINTAGYKAYDWRKLGLYFSLAGLMCGGIAVFWPAMPFAPGFDVLGTLLFGLAAVLLLGAGLRWLARPAQIQLLCIDRTYLQLFGLHQSFLDGLPEWPVPDRDSVRHEA